MPENTSNDTTQNTNYTVTLVEDGEDLIMPIPEELMAKLGWNENDVLQWVIEDDCINLVKADGNV